MGLFSLFSHDYAEFDLLPFHQYAVSMAADRAEVHKDVAAVPTADETESLIGIKPFDDSGLAPCTAGGNCTRTRGRGAPKGGDKKKYKQGPGDYRKTAQIELKPP